MPCCSAHTPLSLVHRVVGAWSRWLYGRDGIGVCACVCECMCMRGSCCCGSDGMAHPVWDGCHGVCDGLIVCVGVCVCICVLCGRDKVRSSRGRAQSGAR